MALKLRRQWLEESSVLWGEISASLPCANRKTAARMRYTFASSDVTHRSNGTPHAHATVSRQPFRASATDNSEHSAHTIRTKPTLKTGQASPFISNSACSSQYVMPISRYIVVAVVRCSCASCGLPVRRESRPSARWQCATSGRIS
jgi:hypothetical protein